MSGLLGTFLGRRSIDSDGPNSPSAQRSPKSPTSNVWQSVFNPGRNMAGPRNSRDYYDHVDTSSGRAPTVWEQVLKSQNLQRMSFNQLDKDGDGYLSADDLKSHFGGSTNVTSLIDAADKDKDGRISLAEFREVMRTS